MTLIESEIQIKQPVKKVYSFLSDLRHYESLMPEAVSDWSATEEQASFTMQHMGKLFLKISEKKVNESILIIPSEKPPFEVSFTWSLKPSSEGLTHVLLSIRADLNMMMKMLAIGPLKKWADFQTTKLQQILESA